MDTLEERNPMLQERTYILLLFSASTLHVLHFLVLASVTTTTSGTSACTTLGTSS